MAGVLSSEQTAVASAQHAGHGEIPTRAVIRLLMGLKWTLWKRSYRKNVGKIVGTVIGSLYALGGLVGLTFAFLGTTLWSGEGETFPLILRTLGVAAVLVWLLVPLLAFGVDDTLDARAFALLPRRARELQPGLFAAAALSLPSLFTLAAVAVATVFEAIWLLLLGPGPLWTVLALIALVPANLAGVVLCLLLPRAVFAHQAGRASSRSGRELGGILAMVVFLAVVYAFSVGMQSLGALDLDQLLPTFLVAVDVLAWTPIGAPFAVPMDLAEGAVLVALGRATVTAASIWLVWRWWRRSLDAAMTSALTGDASSGTAKVSALVPRWAPSTALGAVIGRSLRYWRRDTRYLAAISIYPVMFVFFGAMGLVLPESRSFMMIMVVAMGGLTGIAISNEIGFDGPAGWVNITAGASARANLLGRIVAAAVIVLPIVLVLSALVAVVLGMAAHLPVILLGVLGLVLSGWGASVLVGVLLPYPTSPPGTNPMKDKSASSANAMLSMAVTSAAVGVPQIPAIGLAIWGLLGGGPLIELLAGIVAVVIGAVVLVVGLRLGSARLERSYPELFQKVRAFV